MLFKIRWLSLLWEGDKPVKTMETIVSLIMLTLLYGLVLLGQFPEKYLKKFNYKYKQQKIPSYLKYRLSEVLFFSFLAGYLIASTMMYFFH